VGGSGAGVNSAFYRRQKLQPALLLLAAAVASAVAAVLAPQAVAREGAIIAAMTFVLLIFGLKLRVQLQRRSEVQRRAHLTTLVGQDATPCFMTDRQGQIQYQNASAETRFQAQTGATLVSALTQHFASPSSVLYRLQNRAGHSGAGREDVVTRRGHTRLSVHKIAEDSFLWRLEEFQDRGSNTRGADALSLPMLTANKSGVVLYTNEAMRRLLGGRPKRLDRVFANPILHSGEEVQVSGIDGPVRAILAEVEGPGERREIYLLPVPSGVTVPSAMADFEFVPVPLAKFTPQGQLIIANAAARTILHLGPHPADEAGQMFHDLFEGLGRPVSDWLDDIVSERIPSRS
jgi:two-component system cell cycle sensor histidine kinase/response regulator CckA